MRVLFGLMSMCLFGAYFCLLVNGEDYLQFRGPNANAISPEPLPTEWSDSGEDTSNIRWKVQMDGEGWSQPIVVGQRVYLTAAVPSDPAKRADSRPESNNGGYGRDRRDLVNVLYEYQVVCIDADTGQQIWRKKLKQGRPPIPRHTTNTYATETPVSDGERIFAYFGMNGVYCLDRDGNVLWQKDPGVYRMRADWGTSSSPSILNGHLFLQVDNEEQSFLVALDTESGDEVWRVNRDEKSQYSSPFIWKNSIRNELIVGGMVYRSYDPVTGELLWLLDMNKGRSSATPVAVGDRLFVGNELRNRGGSDDGGGRLYCVKPGGTGNITPVDDGMSGPFIEWRMDDSGIQMASPTYCDGNLYFFERRRGVVTCVDVKTGRLEYKERVRQAPAFWASPWSDGAHVFALDSNGNTHVFAPGDELKTIRINKLDQQAWGTPAISNGRIYIRTVDNLYCIDSAS